MSQSYCALYVDAGYLLAAAATRVTGTSLRAGIEVAHAELIDGLVRQVCEDSGMPLLRTQWYDAARPHSTSPEHNGIGSLPWVKLRLGRMANDGTQKGVDLRLGLDIVNHARHGRIDRLYLVSGDDDLTEAVDEAQNLGAQVIVLAVPNNEGKPHGVSNHLRQTADDVLLIDEIGLDAVIRRRERKAAPAPAAPAPTHQPTDPASSPAAVAARVAAASTPDLSKPYQAPVYTTATGQPASAAVRLHDVPSPEAIAEGIDIVCRKVIESWRRTASPDDRARLHGAKPSVPSELDRALLLDLSARLDNFYLDDTTRYKLRTRFWEILDEA
ncbi:MAG TPA: NYN domain-containing protein [Flexivirga sp.]|uniref:NYN domain-containing protein n=1 Tax=Flexivirga sp. TaxID=1962927 RepID=UPI002CD3B23E|nr:NYN domain-containing protein [Flexivirga sp.]HWC23865.1 NYN domain-containing protein [Flexivirga sp.]